MVSAFTNLMPKVGNGEPGIGVKLPLVELIWKPTIVVFEPLPIYKNRPVASTVMALTAVGKGLPAIGVKLPLVESIENPSISPMSAPAK